MSFKYEKKHIDFLVNLKLKNISLQDITESFNLKFKLLKTAKSIELCLSRYKHLLKSSISHTEAVKSKTRLDIIKKYYEYIKKYNKLPILNELEHIGVSPTSLRRHFSGLKQLDIEVRKLYPDIYNTIIDESIFTDSNFELLKEKLKDYTKFVVTSAVTNCQVHEKALKALENYCFRNNALLLILPCSDPAKSLKHDKKWTLSSKLLPHEIVFKDLQLNNNLFLSSIKLSAKQINPLTGLSRVGQRKGCFIYASPKQFLEYVATSNDNSDMPRALMTTGAITVPDYDTDRYMGERLAYMAKQDHLLGAIIIELDKELGSENYFHYRQIQFEPKTGSFIDIDTKYLASGDIKSSKASLFKIPDFHVDETDPIAISTWKDIIKVTNPDYVSLEDFFNGTSINHHEQGQIITKAIKSQDNLLGLDRELKACNNQLKEILSWNFNKLVMIYGNHENFLFRYLNEFRFKDDPENQEISLKLSLATLQNKNPFQFAMQDIYGLSSKKEVIWLKEDESFKLQEIENGAHGHLGPNGTRNPSLIGLEKSYGLGNFNHSHVPGIYRGAYRGGTSTYLDSRVKYKKGPSAWMQTGILQHPNGSRQLINIVNGKWRDK